MLSLVDVGPVALEKKIFYFSKYFYYFNVFVLFLNYPPFEKGVAFHLNKRESPSPDDTLFQVYLKLAKWF